MNARMPYCFLLICSFLFFLGTPSQDSKHVFSLSAQTPSPQGRQHQEEPKKKHLRNQNAPFGLNEKQYLVALGFYLSGDYGESLGIIRSIFDQTENLFPLRLLATANYIATKQYAQAQAHIRIIRKNHPHRVEPDIFHAKLLRETARHTEALESMKVVIKQNPQNPFLYLEAATIYYQMKNYPRAKKHLRRVLELDPQNYYAFYLDGLIFLKQGQYEKARFRFHNAKAIHPKNKADIVSLYNNLALSLEAQGLEAKKNNKIETAKRHYRQAQQYYEQALGLEPKNITLRENKRRIEQLSVGSF